MEKPNLTYIDSIARGDIAIKKELIDVIKKEFPEEKNEYFLFFKLKDYKKIEDSVHKLKHKISILGLENSYRVANEYEHNLRNNDLAGANNFNKLLIIISEFLKRV